MALPPLRRAYVAELAKVMPDREAPPAGTPEHARLLELVASMRRLLAIFLAEHVTTMRELRKCAAALLVLLICQVNAHQQGGDATASGCCRGRECRSCVLV